MKHRSWSGAVVTASLVVACSGSTESNGVATATSAGGAGGGTVATGGASGGRLGAAQCDSGCAGAPATGAGGADGGVALGKEGGRTVEAGVPWLQFRIDGGPSSVAIADLNGDGKLDIVATSSSGGPNGTGAVLVLLNDGNGIPAAPLAYAAGVTPSSVTIGDISGDGKADLVVVNGRGGAGGNGGISVLVNQGDGTFAPPVGYAVGVTAGLSVAIGDVDGDAKLDVAVGSGASSAGNVSLFLNDGHGGLSSPVVSSPGGWSVALGDLDGDHHVDLAFSPFLPPQPVTVRLNDGTGAFGAPATYGSATFFFGVGLQIADVNGDSKGDIVASWPGRDSSPGGVYILTNNGDGTFATEVSYASGAVMSDQLTAGPPGTGPNAVAVGDLDGDGKPDLAVANSGGSTASGNVSVLLNDGRGGFEPPVQHLAGVNAAALALGDLNGDGKLDVAVADPTHSVLVVSLNPFP